MKKVDNGVDKEKVRLNWERMAAGKLIVCGIWPYFAGIKLTVKGYNLLRQKRCSIKVFAPGALSLQQFNRHALIGMTRALRKKLKGEVAMENEDKGVRKDA